MRGGAAPTLGTRLQPGCGPPRTLSIFRHLSAENCHRVRSRRDRTPGAHCAGGRIAGDLECGDALALQPASNLHTDTAAPAGRPKVRPPTRRAHETGATTH